MNSTTAKTNTLISALFCVAAIAGASSASAAPLYDADGWTVTSIPAKGELRERCQLQKASAEDGPRLRFVELPKPDNRQLVVILSPVNMELEGKGGSFDTVVRVDKKAPKTVSMRWRKGRNDAIALSYSETDINGLLKSLAWGFVLTVDPSNSDAIKFSLKGSAKAVAILDNCMKAAAAS